MFCKGYDAFTAIVKLPLAPRSQVVLYLTEWVTSALLPRSWKPPQPAREELCWTGTTAEFRQVVALCSEDTSFVSALRYLLWRKGLEPACLTQGWRLSQTQQNDPRESPHCQVSYSHKWLIPITNERARTASIALHPWQPATFYYRACMWRRDTQVKEQLSDHSNWGRVWSSELVTRCGAALLCTLEASSRNDNKRMKGQAFPVAFLKSALYLFNLWSVKKSMLSQLPQPFPATSN